MFLASAISKRSLSDKATIGSARSDPMPSPLGIGSHQRAKHRHLKSEFHILFHQYEPKHS